MVWTGVNEPLLIVGLGALLIGALLPWLTAGMSTDRWLRGALMLAGALACSVALQSLARSIWSPHRETAASAVVEGAFRPVATATLTSAACVDALSRRMGELTAASRLASIADADGALPADPIGLVSGSATGTYHAVADDLVAVARRQGVPLFNRETLGSLDNLRKLADPAENAALGFAQSDILAVLARANDPADRKAAMLLRLVLPLYAEEVHVLARAGVRTLADLAGRHVVIAASSQGSLHTADNLLRAAGITPASLNSQQTAASALCSVLTGRADAMVIVAGKPTTHLVSLDALLTHPARPLDQVHLLPLALPVQNVGYEVASIKPDDYVWVKEPVDTLAVRALLMAFDFSPQRTDYQRRRCRQLQRLGSLMQRELPVLARPPHHVKWREVDPKRPVSGWRFDTCSRVHLGH
ncbi:MAG: ABC transporter substrate-binding protein [Sphaerotilus sp.]|nr:ABC transporter substrate-binding protein [Sphaerotilus sp.]